MCTSMHEITFKQKLLEEKLPNSEITRPMSEAHTPIEAVTCLPKNCFQNCSPMAVDILVPYVGWMHMMLLVMPQSPASESKSGNLGEAWVLPLTSWAVPKMFKPVY